MIVTENHGPLIVSSTFWGSDLDRAGKIYVSVNAGAVRVLLPASARPLVNELRAAEYAILSRGPWPEVGAAEAVEILWEDHTDSPFAWQLTAASFDLLPGEPDAGREWVISLWDVKKDRPHKALERPCRWRRVAKLPWLKPWAD
jgi:hypothetical protein